MSEDFDDILRDLHESSVKAEQCADVGLQIRKLLLDLPDGLSVICATLCLVDAAMEASSKIEDAEDAVISLVRSAFEDRRQERKDSN